MWTFKTTDPTHMRLDVAGKLTRDDYAAIAAKVETAIAEEGHHRLLFALHDFKGWTVAGAIEGVRFDVRHREDFDRIAVVGDRRWQEWSTKLTGPIFDGDVRWFDKDREHEAVHWLQMG